ncbi:MAG: NADPH:quinone oxidoreductase family protein [Flavobacteriaceae bacterium]
MKAILCETLGPPSQLQYKECPSPSPKEKEVVVKVHVCSLNFPDTLIIQGKYQIQPSLPFTPGSDISGEVVAVGSAVKHLSVGDAVFGLLPYGGLAEYVAAPATSIFPKPPTMSHEVAASFMMAYGTSLHALKDRAQLKKGETLVVLGASGGVGSAAIVLGKLMGARVIACAATQKKIDFCLSQGADAVINYSKEDLKSRIKELTDDKGADVIYDAVGGHYSEPALRAMAWAGRFLVVGFAAGDIPKIPLNLPLLKSCQLVGVFWGSWAMQFPAENMANTLQLIQWHQEGQINPYIDTVYPLEETPQAMEAMMQRKIKGKVVIKCIV